MAGKANHKKQGIKKAHAERKQISKPVCPCTKCPEREKAALGVCNGGIGICKENLDYQRRLWELKNMGGD